MNAEISGMLAKYSEEIRTLFSEIRKLILNSAPGAVEEKLWAKLPSFCVGNKFIRVIPFKDHVNIEAAPVLKYKPHLKAYKITPKGMLQIYLGQELPHDVLNSIVTESFL